MMNKALVFILFLTTGWIVPAFVTNGQILRPGPQVASFYSEIDDSEQPYGLYVPPGYDPQKTYPLVSCVQMVRRTGPQSLSKQGELFHLLVQIQFGLLGFA